MNSTPRYDVYFLDDGAVECDSRNVTEAAAECALEELRAAGYERSVALPHDPDRTTDSDDVRFALGVGGIKPTRSFRDL